MKKIALGVLGIGALAFFPVQEVSAQREDCIRINPRLTRVARIQGRWKIVQGSMWIKDFGSKRAEAYQSLKIIKRYGLNKQCFVGRPNPSFEYWLVNRRAPRGRMAGEDCVSFNPRTTRVRRVQGRWKIVDGRHWMFDFNQNRREAVQSMRIIRRYRFNKSCFVGRPGPSFKYLRN